MEPLTRDAHARGGRGREKKDLKAHKGVGGGGGEDSGGVGGIECVFVPLLRPTDVQEQTWSADLEEIVFASLKPASRPGERKQTDTADNKMAPSLPRVGSSPIQALLFKSHTSMSSKCELLFGME